MFSYKSLIALDFSIKIFNWFGFYRQNLQLIWIFSSKENFGKNLQFIQSTLLRFIETIPHLKRTRSISPKSSTADVVNIQFEATSSRIPIIPFQVEAIILIYITVPQPSGFYPLSNVCRPDVVWPSSGRPTNTHKHTRTGKKTDRSISQEKAENKEEWEVKKEPKERGIEGKATIPVSRSRRRACRTTQIRNDGGTGMESMAAPRIWGSGSQ